MRDPIIHLHFAAELLHDTAPEIKDPSERRRAATTLAAIARALIRLRSTAHSNLQSPLVAPLSRAVFRPEKTSTPETDAPNDTLQAKPGSPNAQPAPALSTATPPRPPQPVPHPVSNPVRHPTPHPTSPLLPTRSIADSPLLCFPGFRCGAAPFPDPMTELLLPKPLRLLRDSKRGPRSSHAPPHAIAC